MIVRVPQPMTSAVAVVLDRAALRAELCAAVAEAIAQREAPAWVAVKACGLPPRSLRAAARRGELALRRIGRADYVARAELDAWVARQPGPDAVPSSGVRGDELGELFADDSLEVAAP